MTTTPSAWSTRLQAAWLERGLFSALLLPLAWLFDALVRLRKAMYTCGWLQTYRAPVPVVVVGNLVAGGAGKTPTVIAVVELLRRAGWMPGVLSRGYGRHTDALVDVRTTTSARDCGDEPLLIHRRTQAPVVVSRDRAAAAQALLHAHPQVDVLVSDDGLQHLRLARDVQVLLFDERGVGNGRMLPAGPLREAAPRTPPVRSLVLYNAGRATTAWPGYVAQRRLGGIVELADWWRGTPASLDALDAIRDRRIVAAAGMARPQRFFDMLTAAGLQVEPLPLPDHHDFATLPWPAPAADVIVTEKDAVKLVPDRMGGTRVWVATLDLDPGDAFGAALNTLLEQVHPRHPAKNHGSPTA